MGEQQPRPDDGGDREPGRAPGGSGEATGAGDDKDIQTPAPRTPVTQQIGRVVVPVLIVLFGVFAASNAQPVDFSWIFGATEVTEAPGGDTEGGMPLIVLLLVSFLVGAVVGAVVAWQTGRARRRTEEATTSGPRRAR